MPGPIGYYGKAMPDTNLTASEFYLLGSTLGFDVDLPYRTREVFSSVAGTLSVRRPDGTDIAIPFPAGKSFAIQCIRINSAGTVTIVAANVVLSF